MIRIESREEERIRTTVRSLLNKLGIGRDGGRDGRTVTGGTFAAGIDPGQSRTSNQDQALATRLRDGSVLLAVADGVGGAKGGDVASALAIEELQDAFRDGVDGDVEKLLRRAFAKANDRVLQVGAEVAELEGLASTLVVAVISGGSARIAHAGDSRAYLFDDGTLEQLTDDHSWVAERVRSGQMTKDEAETSPFKHTITRGIGVGPTIEPDVSAPVEVMPGTTLLLCSDGLYGPATSGEIAAVLTKRQGVETAGLLIALANKKGGPDNIGVAVYEA